MSSDYFIGTDVLGADIVEKPFVVDDPNWGVPFVVEDVLGMEHQLSHVLGYIDIQPAQRRMNELKVVTVGVAHALLKGGYEAISGAIGQAKKRKLPGDSARQNVVGKLNWHRDNLAKFPDRNAAYLNAADLKKWVMQAYIEANAVEEGALYLDRAWDRMWAEINEEIAKLPQKAREAVAKTVEAVTGLPIWAWALIAAGGAAVIGGVLYAVINSRAGAAVAGVAARRYL